MGRDRPWMKLYTKDWRDDVKLRLCSLSARGLWVDLMALMHDESEPYGFLAITNRMLSLDQIALLCGRPYEEVKLAWDELAFHGVITFGQHPDVAGQVAYSKRMVRDEEKREYVGPRDKSGRFTVQDMDQPAVQPADGGAVQVTVQDLDGVTEPPTDPSPPTRLSDSDSDSISYKKEVVRISSMLAIDWIHGVVISDKASQVDIPIPENLSRHQEWRYAFMEWAEYRKEEKKALTYLAVKKQLKSMSELGYRESIEAINLSIVNQWVGVAFPERVKGKDTSRVKPKSNPKRKRRLSNVGRRSQA